MALQSLQLFTQKIVEHFCYAMSIERDGKKEPFFYFSLYDFVKILHTYTLGYFLLTTVFSFFIKICNL